ncbi:hypothetical protein KC363_g330 [Hortaea werneckii]|uniref:Hypervirulence associated protein TUDOR domain-containing protein n=1 Tax=Hortaea werneckii TaxID=91943 RepID=A0A3M7FZD8_HORWE|nr:hypothetical protein KC325_g4529 [Hortaea werneckii]KAI6993561.1 hypothetical protein KC359_g5073 [Hortaea werneckii]KAI7145557.1 hypothetical protein KC344_g4394 [Hortaea werneckii]KAI7174009.1 hypothetical protein KC360_g4518 [Hortaea werneckii]KAI7197298.1 hypothetical protein KC363_g330 [Hortaea werneckii]
MADKEIKEGDGVSWQWSGGRPGGVASEVKEQGEMTMETKRGNEVKKNAEPDNPAVKVDREGHDVVKKASELEVEEEGPNHKEDGEKQDDKKDEEKNEEGEEKDEDKNEADGEEKKDGEEPQAGEKRKADDGEKEDESESKKAKKDEAEPKENGEKPAPKKKGRPAKNGGAGGPAKETKKKEPKRAATESGQPRRSGRNASK